METDAWAGSVLSRRDDAKPIARSGATTTRPFWDINRLTSSRLSGPLHLYIAQHKTFVDKQNPRRGIPACFRTTLWDPSPSHHPRGRGRITYAHHRLRESPRVRALKLCQRRDLARRRTVPPKEARLRRRIASVCSCRAHQARTDTSCQARSKLIDNRTLSPSRMRNDRHFRPRASSSVVAPDDSQHLQVRA